MENQQIKTIFQAGGVHACAGCHIDPSFPGHKPKHELWCIGLLEGKSDQGVCDCFYSEKEAYINDTKEVTNLNTERCNMEGQEIKTTFKAGGKKWDGEKVRMDLLSPVALEQIAKVMTFGAKKYGDNNWRLGIAWNRVIGASLRHLFAFIRREEKDPETGLSHLAHLGCCVMFLLEYEVTHKELDDRYDTNKVTK